MKNLITDIAGLRVGNASDTALKSGCTVVTADQPFTCGVHVMGGAPGTRETDLLAPHRTVQQVDALVLSGGSAFGLEAASGVAGALARKGRGFAVAGHTVPIVPSAILFDLANGGDKSWDANPYNALGQQAFDAASVDFGLGTHGAGSGCTTATLKGGLGSASDIVGDYRVGALVAVNALGSATVGQHFWAAPFERDHEFGGLGAVQTYSQMHPTKLDTLNTTLAVIATDAPLNQAQCTRLATAAHAGLARAIVPSHTPFDGDLVFGLSTASGAVDDAVLMRLCNAAATTLSRAIARGVFHASPDPNDELPCWSDLPD
ncbi:P1 family peptidase [Nereida sp. MMG025]|uniref:P1 family peptidase n=1 Tax=Nereida sp. MMG025 TaxID=2909981 RepID=UPI00351D4CFB